MNRPHLDLVYVSSVVLCNVGRRNKSKHTRHILELFCHVFHSHISVVFLTIMLIIENLRITEYTFKIILSKHSPPEATAINIGDISW